MRCRALLIGPVMVACVLAPPIRAVTVAHASWDKARTTLARPDFLPKVRIFRKSATPKAVKGRLLGTTSAGVRLAREGSEMFVGREEIHSIRLVPRKASTHRHRTLALAGGIPAGIGAAFGTVILVSLATGGFPEGGLKAGGMLGFFAIMVGVPVWLYRLAIGADRAALLVILDENAAHEHQDANQ